MFYVHIFLINCKASQDIYNKNVIIKPKTNKQASLYYDTDKKNFRIGIIDDKIKNKKPNLTYIFKTAESFKIRIANVPFCYNHKNKVFVQCKNDPTYSNDWIIINLKKESLYMIQDKNHVTSSNSSNKFCLEFDTADPNGLRYKNCDEKNEKQHFIITDNVKYTDVKPKNVHKTSKFGNSSNIIKETLTSSPTINTDKISKKIKTVTVTNDLKKFTEVSPKFVILNNNQLTTSIENKGTTNFIKDTPSKYIPIVYKYDILEDSNIDIKNELSKNASNLQRTEYRFFVDLIKNVKNKANKKNSKLDNIKKLCKYKNTLKKRCKNTSSGRCQNILRVLILCCRDAFIDITGNEYCLPDSKLLKDLKVTVNPFDNFPPEIVFNLGDLKNVIKNGIQFEEDLFGNFEAQLYSDLKEYFNEDLMDINIEDE